MATPAPAPQYRTVTPYLVVPDGEAELRFIKEGLGGTEHEVHRHEGGAIQHAEVRIGDSLVMIGQSGPGIEARAAAIYLWVPDVDATYARALAAGATSER